MGSTQINGTGPVWEWAALCRRAGLRSPDHAPREHISISSLTDDSRNVASGACFVAVSGQDCDGHDFVAPAIRGGASAVVVQHSCEVPDSVVQLVVDDTRSALARLAAAYWGVGFGDDDRMRLVGVTGTNGKTTVTWLVRSALVAVGHRPALLGTIEYDLVSERFPAALTTPGAVELCRHLATARDAGADVGILEVSSHALDQRRCDGLRFDVGVFTNLSGDHLDYHGDMTSYANAKRRLFELLSDDGTAVINADDPVGREFASSLRGRVIRFGLDTNQVDVTAEIRASDRRGVHLTIHGPRGAFDLRSPLVGRHNVYNVLSCYAVCLSLGISEQSVRAGLETPVQIPGRLQRVGPVECPFDVFVDYAHTDAALANALSALRPMTRGRLICVFGCGGDRDRSKRPRMLKAVAEQADVAIVTSDNPRTEDPQSIIEDILAGWTGSDTCRVEHDVNRRAAIGAAIRQARPGDTVLIAGKGHETYQIIGKEVRPFDDAAMASAFLCQDVVMEEAV